MRTARWFWGTFAFWCLLGGAGLSRALLWGPESPARADTKPFQAGLNGFSLQGEVWTFHAETDKAVASLDREWASSGFTPLFNGKDLMLLFVKDAALDAEVADVLHRVARLHLYKSHDRYRVLGLLRHGNEGNLCGIHLDIPEKALTCENLDPSTDPTPATPPPGAQRASLACGPLVMTLWTFPRGIPAPSPRSWGRASALSLTPLTDAPGEAFIVLAHGRRFLLVVVPSSEGPTWVWTPLPFKRLSARSLPNASTQGTRS